MAAIVVASIALVVALIGGPASAQDTSTADAGSTTSSTTSSTSSSTSSTTVAPTSEPAPATETTAPDQTTATNGTATTGAGSDPSDDSTASTTTSEQPNPESTDTTDPLIDEAPADDPLDPNITVPPPSGADVEVDFAPVPILWSNVREAESKWADALTDKVEAIVEVRTLRLRAKELDSRQSELEERTRLTIDELAEATDRLQARAVRGFVRSSSGNATGAGLTTAIFRSRDALIEQRRNRLIGAVVDVDQVSLAELAELRSTLGTSAYELLRRSGVVDASIRRAEATTLEFDAAVEQARIELEAFKAGSQIYVDGVVFPIGGPYSVPLINSFGFPRMPGTPDAHAHQGIDIFAPRGTPLVAAERGVVGRVGIGRLGGLKLWLRGESGADWYYAHLDGFAPGLHNGQLVEAGELLGYVGNTGNAVGTPPHLHMEIHPSGGAAVNPYPLLKVVSDLDLNSEVDDTDPGFRYQPVVANRPEEVATPSTSAIPATPTPTSDTTPTTSRAPTPTAPTPTSLTTPSSSTSADTTPTSAPVEPSTSGATTPSTEPTSTGG